MNTAEKHTILTHGLFLSLAISSRFLLNFQEGILASIVSFVLLFGIYSALIIWLKEYQQTLPEKKINLKQVFLFTVKVFLIGSIIASFFKYYYFQYIKPSVFQSIIGQYEAFYGEYLSKFNELLLTAKKENNTNDIAMLKNGIETIEWWKSVVINAYFTPFISIFSNIIGGTLLGWFIWPLFKHNQQNPNPTPINN